MLVKIKKNSSSIQVDNHWLSPPLPYRHKGKIQGLYTRKIYRTHSSVYKGVGVLPCH